MNSTRAFSFFLLAMLGATPVLAQKDLAGAAAIKQSMERLKVLGSVLMIAAHPDDENTAVLAYFARGRHLETGYLSLTRGEGGQNFIGTEQGARLGIIRTEGVAGRPPYRRRPAVFHARHRLRIHQDRRRRHWPNGAASRFWATWFGTSAASVPMSSCCASPARRGTAMASIRRRPSSAAKRSARPPTRRDFPSSWRS